MYEPATAPVNAPVAARSSPRAAAPWIDFQVQKRIAPFNRPTTDMITREYVVNVLNGVWFDLGTSSWM
jgi:hypothetical protein